MRGRNMTRHIAPRLLTAATTASILFPSLAQAVQFPYVPTQILMPTNCLDKESCSGASTAYIFHTSDDDNSTQFLSLDYGTTKSLDENSEFDVVSKSLPWKGSSFAAARAGDGSVVVYAGDCDGGVGEIWRYTNGSGNGWAKGDEVQGTGDDTARGPYYMGGTVAFSSTVAPEMDEPTLYTYGGMCSSPSEESNWQSAGTYTKSMMSLSPVAVDGSDDDDASTAYELGVASTLGPRSPMAGFTMTGLSPWRSNVSGTVTQQMGYVLLGGHTDVAFINMSTAAVWKLPEESWSYVNILSPIIEPKTKDNEDIPDNVYSRSGHSAVLSADGQKIIVMGGWVGDTSTPAVPQLAVLEMSQAYSGWRWSIPKNQPTDDANGVFGHAAAVLPGDVMMVYGGWEIHGSGSSAAVKKRADDTGARFLNLTSMEWGSNYDNPDATSTDDSSSDDTGNDDNSSGDSSSDNNDDNGNETSNDAPQSNGTDSKTIRLGLGLGLGLGIGLLILLILGLVCFFRIRKKRRATARDSAIAALAQDAGHFRHDDDEMIERDDLYPWPTEGWYTGGSGPYQQEGRSLGYESLRGNRDPGMGMGYPGALGSVQRKPVPSNLRGGYVPTGNGGMGSGSGGYMTTIHPIMEDDEEDYGPGRAAEPHTPTSEVHSDPFMTPTATHAPPILAPVYNRASATPSPERDERRYDPEVQDWVSDAEAAETLLASMNSRRGRISPTRRNSNRSAAMRDDDSRHGSNLSDSSAKLTPKRSAFGGSTLLGGSEVNKPGSSSSSSYATAKSAFGTLQAEGPALLLGRNSPADGGDEEDMQAPGSPSKSKPRRGWLGSLRRVFSTSGTTTPASSRDDDSPGLRGSYEYMGDYEVRPGLNGELLRRKQGRHDWDAVDVGSGSGRRRELGTEEDREDWDIEKAVENRLVQVMFSVPKERLRVVNPDERGDGDSGISRESSARSARSLGERVDAMPAGLKEPEFSEKPVMVSVEEPESHEEIDLGTTRHDDDVFTDDKAEISNNDLRPITTSGTENLRVSEPHEARHPWRSSAHSGVSAISGLSGFSGYSAVSMLSSGSESMGNVNVGVADAVTVEKPPKTRVLRMVEGFEARSREGSPSPTRMS